MGISMDEEQIMDACITGSTVAEIATWTGFSESKVRGLLKTMERRQLVRRYTFKPHRSGREITVWNREGPMD
jgi:predicted ArsR family transcriptional regulator